jgi:RNA polymerase sigma-70 factor (ECF subfamily)
MTTMAMADAGSIDSSSTPRARRFAARTVTRTVDSMSDAAVDDSQLMLAYARGDAHAFELLYSRHRAALYRYLMRQARDAEVTSDLFQEVWSRVIATRARYEPRAKFQTYLFTLAHNCFIDHCRRMKTRPSGLSVEAAASADLLAAPDELRPDDRLERSELRQQYQTALAALPAEQRDAFLLHEESDLSVEEIATVMGVGAETAKSRLRYAVNKLKAALSTAEGPA